MHSSSIASGLIYQTNNSFCELEALISCQSPPLFIFALICCCIYFFHLYALVHSHVFSPPCPFLSLSCSMHFFFFPFPSALYDVVQPPDVQWPLPHPPITSVLRWVVASGVEVSPSLTLVSVVNFAPSSSGTSQCKTPALNVYMLLTIWHTCKICFIPYIS